MGVFGLKSELSWCNDGGHCGMFVGFVMETVIEELRVRKGDVAMDRGVLL